jgi:hypothetical protein
VEREDLIRVSLGVVNAYQCLRNWFSSEFQAHVANVVEVAERAVQN